MRVACVMMQRNEEDCLEPWLRFHGYLFGYFNLFVIDHGSDDPAVLEILARYQRLGVHVFRLPAEADFRRKGEFVSAALQQADRTGFYDILLPLDCDEFVVMRDADGRPRCERAALLAYFETLAGETAMLHVKENFLNTLGHPGVFFALSYQKVFFTRGGCGTVDEGSHTGTSPRSTEAKPTRLVYAHFHHKTYEKLQRNSREKLRHFLDVDDRAALLAYEESRSIGWHLILNIRRTKEEYMSIMRPGGLSIEFPEIIALFKDIGIDPLFCDR
jgi:hypothetical protein